VAALGEQSRQRWRQRASTRNRMPYRRLSTACPACAAAYSRHALMSSGSR
jgi:hypothetical protein